MGFSSLSALADGQARIDAVALYFESFLLMVVAVTKEDPLMAYYPKVRGLLVELSGLSSKKVRLEFFSQMLRNLGSFDKVDSLFYVGKAYLRGELMQRALSDEGFFHPIFELLELE